MSNSFKTFLKHTAKDFHNQSVNPPIVRASTIIFKSMQDIRKTQEKAKKNPTGGHFDTARSRRRRGARSRWRIRRMGRRWRARTAITR